MQRPCHDNVQCRGCGMLPLLGVRYRCTLCIDFNLCAICFAYDVASHDDAHPIEAMKRPRGDTRDSCVMAVEEMPGFTFTAFAPPFK